MAQPARKTQQPPKVSPEVEEQIIRAAKRADAGHKGVSLEDLRKRTAELREAAEASLRGNR